MKEQKFKRGNLVEILVGHQIHIAGEESQDISPENIGRKAIIEYSYAEKYGGNDVDSYSIIFLDDGNSLSWKHTNELKFIEDGGEHLFEEAKKNKKIRIERDTDITYILSKLDSGSLSSTSILFLFNLLGFESSFLRNGEFFVLYDDWNQLYPVFILLKNAKTIDEILQFFTEEALIKYKVKEVYNAFHEGENDD
jgi:hypothetical protein